MSEQNRRLRAAGIAALAWAGLAAVWCVLVPGGAAELPQGVPGTLRSLLVLPLVYGVMVFAFLTLPCLLLGVGVYPFTVARCFAGGIAALARGIAGLPGAVLPCAQT